MTASVSPPSVSPPAAAGAPAARTRSVAAGEPLALTAPAAAGAPPGPPAVAPRTDRRSPAVSARTLGPLLGSRVVVRTTAGLWRGTLLSCVRASAWFVVDDVDVVVPLDDLVSVRAA